MQQAAPSSGLLTPESQINSANHSTGKISKELSCQLSLFDKCDSDSNGNHSNKHVASSTQIEPKHLALKERDMPKMQQPAPTSDEFARFMNWYQKMNSD